MKDSLKNIFRDPPVLFTQRTVLRKLERGDSAHMFIYAGDPQVSKYLLWSPHPSESYSAKYLSAAASRYRSGECFDWAVVYEGRMIGNCGFSYIDEKNSCAQIGYVLARDMWGKGLAAEAAARIVEFGFEVLGLHRIEARFMEENAASRRVAEKTGMSFEGVLRGSMLVKGRYVNIGICAVTKEDFLISANK